MHVNYDSKEFRKHHLDEIKRLVAPLYKFFFDNGLASTVESLDEITTFYLHGYDPGLEPGEQIWPDKKEKDSADYTRSSLVNLLCVTYENLEYLHRKQPSLFKREDSEKIR